MITLCSIPKAFHGHFGVIQHNALQSWRQLEPTLPIVLFGDEAGTAKVAAEIGARHVPDVPRNEFGTPRLDGVLELAEQFAETESVCYLNADIILLPDFLTAARDVARRKRQFLMVGQRYDLDITERLRFDPGWHVPLRHAIEAHGQLGDPTHIDYFVYNRRLWRNIPPFAIGRFCWDNWLIYEARRRHVLVIDATPSITAIHQRHDYRHAAGGYKGARFGPEARHNRQLAGDRRHLYTIWDSTHVLRGGALERREQSGLGGGIWSYRRSTSPYSITLGT